MPFGCGENGHCSIGMPRRSFSADSNRDSTMPHQLPPPAKESLDFMSPLQKRPIKTAPFRVLTEGREGIRSFEEAVNEDKLTCKNHFEVENLRKLFQVHEAPLKVRGLLSPFSLHDKRSQGLHWAYNSIVDNVVYLTSSQKMWSACQG